MALFYQDVLAALQQAGVRSVVVGGLAVILHGVPRTTVDLDLAVDLDERNLARLVETLERLGYVPRGPVAAADLPDPAKRKEWVEEKNMLAFTFVRPGRAFEEVDILIGVPIEFPALWARAEKVTAGSITFAVAGIDDLIRLKEASGRAQDAADADALRRLQEARRG